MRKYFIFILSLVLIIMLSACNGLSSQPEIVATIRPLPTLNPEHGDDLGAAIFEARCSSCHGITGQGDGAVALEASLDTPDFTRQSTSANQSLNEWINTIRFGRLDNMMPPWENSLSDEEIEAVAAYTFTIWQNYDQSDVETTDVTDTENLAEVTEVANVVREAQGTVSGEILQGTEGEGLPDIISVALQVIDNQGNEAFFEMQVLEGTTTYTFDDVFITNQHTYFITAIYNEMIFYSDILFGTPSNPDMLMPVTIYEMTSDESVIEISLFLMRLIPDPEGVIVHQLVNFNNTSDRVYRGENQIDGFTYDSVRLPLPDEAVLLNQVELIPRFLMLEGEEHQTLLDTQPVLPNAEHMVEVVYSLPISITEPRQTLDLPIRYNVVSPIELMTQPSQYQIVSDDFVSTGTQHFSVGVYESYVSEQLEGNTNVQFDIQVAAEETEASERNERNTMLGLLLLAGVALMVFSGLALLFNRMDKE